MPDKTPTKAELISADTMDKLTTAKSADEFRETLTAALEAAAVSLAAKAGPLPALGARIVAAQVVEPIVGTLMTIVKHIGMAVPMQLGELIERIESGVGFDINGDGFVGDPERASGHEKDKPDAEKS